MVGQTRVHLDHVEGLGHFMELEVDYLLPYQDCYSLSDLGWSHSTAVERRSLVGKLSLSCARPVADG